MTTNQDINPDAIKHEVFLQRQIRARKAEGFLLLTWWGLIACLAWGTGLGYEVADTLGIVPPPENIQLVFVEGLGATVIGGTATLVLKPFSEVLRRLMVTHPDPPTNEEGPEPVPSHFRTALGVSAVAVVLIGIPGTSILVQTTITNEIVKMIGTLSGFFFWLLAAACFVQAYRAVKQCER